MIGSAVLVFCCLLFVGAVKLEQYFKLRNGVHTRVVLDIMVDIEANPETWQKRNDNGIQKGCIIISGWGNGLPTSVIDLYVDGASITLSFKDKYYLESVVVEWFSLAPLKNLRGV